MTDNTIRNNADENLFVKRISSIDYDDLASKQRLERRYFEFIELLHLFLDDKVFREIVCSMKNDWKKKGRHFLIKLAAQRWTHSMSHFIDCCLSPSRAWFALLIAVNRCNRTMIPQISIMHKSSPSLLDPINSSDLYSNSWWTEREMLTKTKRIRKEMKNTNCFYWYRCSRWPKNPSVFVNFPRRAWHCVEHETDTHQHGQDFVIHLILQSHVADTDTWANILHAWTDEMAVMFVLSTFTREAGFGLDGERDDELGSVLQVDRMNKSVDGWGLFLDRCIHQWHMA